MKAIKFEMGCRGCAKRIVVYGNLATISDDERCGECGGKNRVVTHPSIPTALDGLLESGEYFNGGVRMLDVDFLGKDENERLAIACICRCVWLDKALEYQSMGGHFEQQRNCELVAADWKAWGEQK